MRIDLRNQSLDAFPAELLEHKETLEILDLSDNHIRMIPDWVVELKKLRILFVSQNPIESLPTQMSQLNGLRMLGLKNCRIQSIPEDCLPKNLVWLILTNNNLRFLPGDFGTLQNLRKCMLAGNQLESLPSSIASCHQLELLRIANNRILQIPNSVYQLPRLAWLARSGNPLQDLSSQKGVLQDIRRIPPDMFTLRDILGSGASGKVYAADWNQGLQKNPVAIKVYEALNTSDGSTEDEICACLHVGHHPHLIPVLGLTSLDGKEALILERISPDYRVLAGPPSLDSCTRDVYDITRRWSDLEVKALLLQSLSVLAHLHAAGYVHGDFYGHNILWNGSKMYLGDFGAASRIKDLGDPLCKVEVRAWLIFAYEILDQAENTSAFEGVRKILNDLECEEFARIPSFEELFQRLSFLQKV
jgi:hypothetical protein